MNENKLLNNQSNDCNNNTFVFSPAPISGFIQSDYALL